MAAADGRAQDESVRASDPRDAFNSAPRIAAILGPTASGKTALAVELARAGLPIEVICCDASQMIAGLDAATAKPNAEERAAVRHHLIDAFGPRDALNAGTFAALAATAIETVRAAGRWPVLVGGTGLYHRALVQGLVEIPAIDPEIRASLAIEAQTRGLPAMWQELAQLDPTYAATTPAANWQRVLRALEVVRGTGRTFSAWHAQTDLAPRYRCLDIVLDPDRDWLRTRLDQRADAMIDDLLREAASLLQDGVPSDAPGLQALGYREAMDLHLAVAAGELDWETARVSLRQTLHRGHHGYAKRQRTWFAKLRDAHRVDPAHADIAAIAEVLRAHWRQDAVTAGTSQPQRS